MSDGEHISLWIPEPDPIRVAVLGKLAEECNELAGRAARCIIQGITELDPDSGRTNHDELEREMSDVMACIEVAFRTLGTTPSATRQAKKSAGYYRWHSMIEAAK